MDSIKQHWKTIGMVIAAVLVLAAAALFLPGVIRDEQERIKRMPTQTLAAQRTAQAGLIRTQTAVVVEKTAVVQRQASTSATQTKVAFSSTQAAAVKLRQSTSMPLAGGDFRKYQLLVFSTDSNSGIFSVMADGSGQKKAVSSNERSQLCPRFSPDRRWIAFVVGRGYANEAELWLANGDGSNPKLLLKNAGCPAWSPDSRMLAFPNYRDERRLYRVNVDGSGVVKIADAQIPTNGRCTIFSCLSWSPDGKSLVYASNDIFVVEVKGGAPRQLTFTGGAGSPAWSPDGRQIAFGLQQATRVYNIMAMDKDGKNLHQVTYDGIVNTDPSWSPDGAWIGYSGSWMNTRGFFAARPDGSGEIFRLPINGLNISSLFAFVP